MRGVDRPRLGFSYLQGNRIERAGSRYPHPSAHLDESLRSPDRIIVGLD
jgi:hypothetical protein